MKTKFHRLGRALYIASALAVGSVAFLPALVQPASAAGQVTSRSIQLSNSSPSATGVTYNVSFIPTSTATIGGILVDFCLDSPIINSASCTFPTGFTLGTSISVTGPTGITGTWTPSGLQCGAAASNFQVLELTDATAQAPTGSPTPISFQITGVTNTSLTGSFYARIYTFNTSTNTPAAATYCPTGITRGSSFTGNLDFGGAALSTATQVSITATVQETLTFCTSGLVAGSAPANCSAPTTPAVTLGTGSPLTIDPVAVYDNSAGTYRTYMGLATNANSGASVTMKSNWTCNGLSRDSGASCGIPGSAGALTAGTAGFGLKVATGTGTTGSLTAANSYSSGTFHMGSTGSATTYGDQIASTGGAPCTIAISQLTFGATAATTTPAGVYSTNETLIATGTF